MYYLAVQTVTIVDNLSVTTDGQELCRLVCLVLMSRKMVLSAPRPWYRPCYRQSWQVVLRHTLQLDRIECQHPSYSMWAHKPQFSRTETWHLFTFLFPKLFSLINLVCTSRVPYLVIFRPIPDSVLMPDALEPLFLIHHRHQMHVHPLETLISSSVSLVVFPGVKLERDPLYPITSDNLGWLTRYSSDPLEFPPSLIVSTLKAPKKG